MADLKFNCPACGKSFKDVKAELLGRKVKCGCGRVFRVGKKSDRLKSPPRKKSLRNQDASLSRPKLSPPPAPTGIKTVPPKLQSDGFDDSEVIIAELAEPESLDFTEPLAMAHPPIAVDQKENEQQKATMNFWRWLWLGFIVGFDVFTAVLLSKLFFSNDEWVTQSDELKLIIVGGVMTGTGLIMGLMGIVGLATGTCYTKFGQKITGIDGRLHGFFQFSFGSIFLVFGALWLLKYLPSYL